MNYLKYAKEQLGIFVTALIVAMIVFALPKIVHDNYLFLRDLKVANSTPLTPP